MANKKAAMKDYRKNKKRHAHNQSITTELKTIAKKVRTLISAANREEADKVLTQYESKLCKAAKSNVIKKKNASRKISRLRQQWAAIGKKA